MQGGEVASRSIHTRETAGSSPAPATSVLTSERFAEIAKALKEDYEPSAYVFIEDGRLYMSRDPINGSDLDQQIIERFFKGGE